MKTRQLLEHQILVLCRGDEVIAGMGRTGDIFQLPGTPQEVLLWGVRIKRLLMPAEVPVLVRGEGGLVLRLERVGSAPGEVVAADLTFIDAAFGFTVDGHGTVIYEQVDFQTRTQPVILGEPIG